MAVIANLSSPYEASVDRVTRRAFAFPYNPSAAGFITDGDIEKPMYAVSSPYYLNGVLVSEGTYLEPTIGQIWPR